MYNEEYVRLQIDSIPKQEGIALDIGANHGIHTVKIAEKFSKVYAVEPHPDNQKILAEKVEGLDNVEVVDAAITPVNGPIKLYVCSANPGGHTINEGVMGHKIWGHSEDNFHTAIGHTLDTFWKNYLGGEPITFMKVDIEGAEDTAFEGATETLKNNKMNIIMEVHRFVDCERLFKLFTDLGYTVYDIDGTGRPTNFVADNHYILSNK